MLIQSVVIFHDVSGWEKTPKKDRHATFFWEGDVPVMIALVHVALAFQCQSFSQPCPLTGKGGHLLPVFVFHDDVDTAIRQALPPR